MKVISLDTETTGVDLYHGSRPFFVVSADDEGCQYWEWQVDPLTREVVPTADDLREIQQLIDDANQIILQNAGFDVRMLRRFGVDVPWGKVHDTLIASHILASNHNHDLTSLALEYLAVDILPHEKTLERVVQEARRYCRSHLPEWRIAHKDHDEMPSAKEKTFKFDYWLPRAVAMHEDYAPDHEYHTALSSYSVVDAEITLALWKRFKLLLESQDLWSIYLYRMKLPPVIDRMTERGVTYSGERLQELEDSFREKMEEYEEICRGVASHYGVNLTIPKGSRSDALERFLFDTLKLPAISRTDTGKPKMDREAFSTWENTLPHMTSPQVFVKNFSRLKKCGKTLADIENYRRFGVGLNKEPQHHQPNRLYVNWHVLHPNINPTGSATLRFSFSNPNSANIAAGGIEGVNEHSTRYAFGPAPGREWWGVDAQNIELRIQAYEAGETDLIYVFEHPDEPPYFGSYMFVVFDLLHPEKFKEHGKNCKTVYKRTWYQWTKNGVYAKSYGAQREKVDQTCRVPGADDLLRNRFPNMAKLSDRMIQQANRYGCVYTIPDREVNPRRGYPLLCTQIDRNRVLPTVPLNYHIQSTACWWMCKAMINCQEKLDGWREQGFDAHIALQIHDELVFDMPKSTFPPEKEYERLKANPQGFRRPDCNLWRVRALQRIMEDGGKDIGIPTPTGCEYFQHDWGEGVVMT